MNVDQILAAAVILSCGALVQSLIGFGMGVVSIPLLAWAGWSVPEAIGLLLPNVALHTALSCWFVRRDLPWQEVLQVFAWRLVGLAAGIYVLWKVNRFHQDAARQVLGGGVIAMLALQTTARRWRVGWSSGVWKAIAGTCSGFTAGLIGMGGPPLVLWVMHQAWPPRKVRGFLWLSFLLVIPVHIAWMYVSFGRVILHAALLGLAASPAVMVVARLAAGWADRVPQARLRTAMQLFLLAVALRLLWSAG